MTVNMGKTDRMLRLALGLILLATPLAAPLGEGALALWGPAVVGVVLVGTSALRFCPLYRVIGLNTC